MVTPNNYMFWPLTGHHQVVHTMKMVEGCTMHNVTPIRRRDLVHRNMYIMTINPLNPKLSPICYLLALLGAHHFLHVSRIRVKSLTLRRLMSYIYAAPILDVSRSHTTTQHSR